MIPHFLHSTPALLNFSSCHHCDNTSTELRLRSPTSQSQVPLLCYVTQQIDIPCDFSFLLCVKRWLGYSSIHSVLQTVRQQTSSAWKHCPQSWVLPHHRFLLILRFSAPCDFWVVVSLLPCAGSHRLEISVPKRNQRLLRQLRQSMLVNFAVAVASLVDIRGFDQHPSKLFIIYGTERVGGEKGETNKQKIPKLIFYLEI